MDIPIINLASDPTREVACREATVEETIQFTGVAQTKEEEATTLYLNAIQKKETFSDSRFWTADDRLLVKFWVYIHTRETPEEEITFYCDCGKRHTTTIDMRTVGKKYRQIQGKPEREIEFQGEKWIIRPHRGIEVEHLEIMRGMLERYREEKGSDSKEFGEQLARIRVMTVLLAIHDPEVEKSKTWQQQLDIKEKMAANLPLSEFSTLQDMVVASLGDMRHGLDTSMRDGEIAILSDPIKCKDDPEGGVSARLRLPFRTVEMLPTFR